MAPFFLIAGFDTDDLNGVTHRFQLDSGYPQKLNGELKKAEKHVGDLTKSNAEMQKDANKFFTEWSKGLGKIEDPQLRTAAQENLDKTRSRYGEITTAHSKFGEHYNKFLTDLKNQISYLNLDMSDDAMSRLKTNQQTTNADAKALFKSIDDLANATKDYIKSLGSTRIRVG